MIFTALSEMVSAIRATGIDIQDALNEQATEPLVYLLDSAGAGFGYSYEWDAFGPHSRELAVDIADLTPDDLGAQDELSEPVIQAVDRVRSVLDPPDTLGLGRPAWLRLLAAVHYLQRRAGLALTNGDRPPFVERKFDERAIAAAKESIAELS